MSEPTSRASRLECSRSAKALFNSAVCSIHASVRLSIAACISAVEISSTASTVFLAGTVCLSSRGNLKGGLCLVSEFDSLIGEATGLACDCY